MIKISTIVLPIFFFCLSSGSIKAQMVFNDSAKVFSLNEFILSANQSQRLRKEIAQPVQSISEAEIQKTNARSTADLLADQGNIHVQKSQQGGGSPGIWGFEANKILLMVDGVRMNNLIYRGGHLQNVITVDQFMLDKIEVLYGPSSVIYGSDALGGVIHFYSRRPKIGTTPKSISISPSAAVRVGSANKEVTGHAALNISGNKWGSYTGVTFSRFGDLRMGKRLNPAVDSNYFLRPEYVKRFGDRDSVVANGDPFLQVNSGYKQWDVIQKFVYKSGTHTQHTLNLQHSNSGDVPRFDRLTDRRNGNLRFGEWYYGPQTRYMAAYNFQSTAMPFTQKLVATASFQALEESRHDRMFGNDWLENRKERVQVLGLTIFGEDRIGKHQTQMGADIQLNSLNSTAISTHVVTGAERPLDTRYPDGNNKMNSAAVFVNDIFTLNSMWNINAGLRFGYVSLSATLKDSLNQVVRLGDIHQNNFTYSGQIGINYLPTSTHKFTLGMGTGYRVPNIDDLSKIFETAPGSLIVPNEQLQPEQTLTAYGGYTYAQEKKYFVNLTGYFTRLFNGIVTLNGQYNGRDSFYKGNEVYQVLSNQNARNAYITGLTFQANAQVINGLFLYGAAQTTYGRIMMNNGATTPLDHIPPFSAKLGVGYYHKHFNMDLYGLYNGWKRIDQYNLEGEDNQRYALPDGMPSWYTLNFRGTIILGDLFIQPGVENILDMQYRVAFSGINAPGRNFYLALKYNL